VNRLSAVGFALVLSSCTEKPAAVTVHGPLQQVVFDYVLDSLVSKKDSTTSLCLALDQGVGLADPDARVMENLRRHRQRLLVASQCGLTRSAEWGFVDTMLVSVGFDTVTLSAPSTSVDFQRTSGHPQVLTCRLKRERGSWQLLSCKGPANLS
jgi:hypothetical protein